MKTIHNKVLIFYHFQLDNSKQHNVTSVPNSGQPITIKDVLQVLPLDLSHGLYHFRFKSEMTEGSEKITAWIDINNLKAKVPQINGSVFIKILKLREPQHNKLFHAEKLKRAEIIKGTNLHQNGHDHAVHSAPKDYVHPQPHPKPNPIQPHNGSSSKPAPAPTQVKTPPPPQAKNPPPNQTKNPPPNQTKNPPPQTQKPKGQPIKMPTSVIAPLVSPKTQGTKNQSFISFDSPPKGQPPLSKDIQQNLNTFLDQFKDEQTNRQNQRLASLELEQKINKWGYTEGKKINNLTTLLATLHEIWPQWEKVSLVDMLSPEKVNSIFKKAVIKVHPDKNRKRNFKEKYLSKRIFELLNEARKQQ